MKHLIAQMRRKVVQMSKLPLKTNINVLFKRKYTHPTLLGIVQKVPLTSENLAFSSELTCGRRVCLYN